MFGEKVILTEGAIVERIKRQYEVEVDEYIATASLIYDEVGRCALEGIYKQYIDIAVKKDLPIMVMTSTRRADKERIKQSKYREKDIVADNVNFLKCIRAEYPVCQDKIYIGGIMGCKGDAYNGREALSEEEAYKYHSWQAEAFKQVGVDFVFACIMPALTEAIGMAKAMEATGLPYIMSFMIRKDGKLLDGTFIYDAIVTIDEETERKPEGYMVNCVHPKVLKQALAVRENQTEVIRRRFIGIQANASALSPEELNQSVVVHKESLEELVEGMIELYEKYGFKILGGCCGTTDAHIRALAEYLEDKR